MLKIFESESGLCIFALCLEVYISIGESPVAGFLGTNFLVILRNEYIALYAACESNFVVVLLCVCGRIADA